MWCKQGVANGSNLWFQVWGLGTTTRVHLRSRSLGLMAYRSTHRLHHCEHLLSVQVANEGVYQRTIEPVDHGDAFVLGEAELRSLLLPTSSQEQAEPSPARCSIGHLGGLWAIGGNQMLVNKHESLRCEVWRLQWHSELF